MQDHFIYFLPDNDPTWLETCRSFYCTAIPLLSHIVPTTYGTFVI